MENALEDEKVPVDMHHWKPQVPKDSSCHPGLLELLKVGRDPEYLLAKKTVKTYRIRRSEGIIHERDEEANETVTDILEKRGTVKSADWL